MIKYLEPRYFSKEGEMNRTNGTEYHCSDCAYFTEDSGCSVRHECKIKKLHGECLMYVESGGTV